MNNIDDSIVEKVWQELDGQVSREQVSRVVAEVALGFQDATVTTYVPIFIQRQAVEQLKRQPYAILQLTNNHRLFADAPWRDNKPAVQATINLSNKGMTQNPHLASPKGAGI